MGEFRRFGPVAQARFDHHLPPACLQQRGILYAAASSLTALAEAFQRRRTIDVESGRPWLVGFAAAEALALLDLTGLWPTVAGASMALSSGFRPRARRWSQAIYTAFPEGRGLWHLSSMAGNAPALALFERAEFTLPTQPFFHRPLDDPALRDPLRRAARRLGYGLVRAT